MQLSTMKVMTELVQVLVVTCSTALNYGCYGEGPLPASWRATSIAARSNRLVMDPPGLRDTKVLRRAIPWTVKRRGNPAPNASAPVCMSEVACPHPRLHLM
jgi:hypothetical protein